MTPAALRAASFAGYPAAGRAFAVEHLALLQRLPLAVCPSFLQQILNLDTSFPAERSSLRSQCDGLQRLDPGRFDTLAAPFAALNLPGALETMDWVKAPQDFVTALTASLWSSGQVNRFRVATTALFTAVPMEENPAHRLVFVVLGEGARINTATALRKLARNGVTLNALRFEEAWAEMRTALSAHAKAGSEHYASWYVEGGSPHPALAGTLDRTIAVSYAGLAPLRERILGRMQSMITKGSGAEQMRTELTGTTLREAGAAEISGDPVLQRFYTELLTESSGPQIFSTSFVQWTGRELARRVQPETLLLRYTPRQKSREMDRMFAVAQTSEMDAQGAFRDAEMAAYYNWLEMRRISAPGKLTFVAWVEDRPLAIVLGANAPTGSLCSTPMTLTEAISNFG